MVEAYLPRINEASPSERGRIIKSIAAEWGCSADTVYRRLKAIGWRSGRQKRRDWGESEVPPETLDLLAALLKSGVRKNGKATRDIPTARQELESEGYVFGVGNARLAALLRQRSLDLKSQRAPAPHTRLRSLYPNHVHQVDPSLCLLYYLPGGGQKMINDDEVYKNKPFLENKKHLKVWRYVLTDHYSCSVCVRYYRRAGESMEGLWEFLLYAWGLKDEANYLFHGVPEILALDRGSANLGGGIENALKSLRVDQVAHAVGNPRAKGQVEKMNHLVEVHFESRLKTEPVGSVEELNELVGRWCALYNEGSIQGFDSHLRRAGKTRLELWSSIGHEQLRELPDEARELLVSRPVSRKVAGDLTVSFRHPGLRKSHAYLVGGLAGIRAGMAVSVQPILMDAGGTVLVCWKYEGEEYTSEVQPVVRDEAGFPVDAAVWGQQYKRPADTAVDVAARRLDELIGEDSRPFATLNGGLGIRSVSAIRRDDSNVSPLPRRGERIDVEDVPTAMINPVAAAMVLKRRLGFWRPEYLEVIRDTFGESVPEARLGEVEEVLRGLEEVRNETATRAG